MRAATSWLLLRNLGSIWWLARVTHCDTGLPRRSPLMTRLCWPITCSATPSSPSGRARLLWAAHPLLKTASGEQIDEHIKIPELVLRATAHAVAFNGVRKCGLP